MQPEMRGYCASLLRAETVLGLDRRRRQRGTAGSQQAGGRPYSALDGAEILPGRRSKELSASREGFG